MMAVLAFLLMVIAVSALAFKFSKFETIKPYDGDGESIPPLSEMSLA
jgi:hypothetical protein